jgi:hypothetical protein
VRVGVGTSNRLVVALGAVALAAYCWFSAGLRPFTLPISVAVAVPAVVVAVLTWRSSRPGVSEDVANQPAPWRRATPWIALLGALATLEIVEYFSTPRQDHPTLSSIADDLMSTHPARAAMFALWLLLGWALLLRQAPA